jgi:adenylate cyclase
VQQDGVLSPAQEQLLQELAQGRPVKAIAASLGQSAQIVNDAIDRLFLELARGASSGRHQALRQLRMLHEAITLREEQGETLSRLLPGGLAEKLRLDSGAADRTERLVVTVLMSDVRGYSAIAEHSDPAVLAGQLNAHRGAMNAAILGEHGTVMQYVGDAVMAVFGAPDPQPDHAGRAVAAAVAMHERQRALDAQWSEQGLSAFGLGIGLSTGEVAAALLGSAERLEYTLVGDTVNLAQRLQDLARPPGTTVAGQSTLDSIAALEPESISAVSLERPDISAWDWEPLGAREVKGRAAPVTAYRLLAPPPRSTPRIIDLEILP